MSRAPVGWTGAVMGPPSYVRYARYAHAVLASAFVAWVVVQVFFAGVGVFGADWSFHTYFVPLFGLMLPPTFVLAFVGRLPLVLKLAPVGLWALITVQYALANAGGPDVVAALHPANGLLIFWISLEVARRSWRIAPGKKTARKDGNTP
jgi:mercuric ion transport protein